MRTILCGSLSCFGYSLHLIPLITRRMIAPLSHLCSGLSRTTRCLISGPFPICCLINLILMTWENSGAVLSVILDALTNANVCVIIAIAKIRLFGYISRSWYVTTQSRGAQKFAAELAPRYRGPFQIVRFLTPVTVLLRDHINDTTFKTHLSRLKP
jgi:hypothetical protein